MFLRRTKEFLLVLLLTIVFATGLKSCIVDAYKIPSGSMQPTMNEGDFLAVNKFIYGSRSPQKFLYISLPQFRLPAFREVQRGHVVVFEFPGEPNEVIQVRNMFLVKRCVGLPGDTVEITDGKVAVNGSAMNFFGTVENDFSRTVVPMQGMSIPLSTTNFSLWKVFIQREGSSIETRNGTIFIDGVESDSYTVKRNYYFMLGDNINSSSDSRHWGAVSSDNIIGKPMFIYWSADQDGIQWSRIGRVIR